MGEDKRTRQELLDAYTERLIRQTEAEGLLRAPVHMKKEILERSEAVDYQLRIHTREIPRRLQFLCYSLKVGAAVAMALFLIFMVPVGTADIGPAAEQISVRQESLGVRLNQRLHSWNQMLTEINWSVDYENKTED